VYLKSTINCHQRTELHKTTVSNTSWEEIILVNNVTNLKKQLKKEYKVLGFFNNNSPQPLLYKCCNNTTCCWTSALLATQQQIQITNNNIKYWGITRPHIGLSYPQTKLLVLGINHRNNFQTNCYDSETLGIKDASLLILNGNQNGIYYHIAKYSAIILKRYNKIGGSLRQNQKAKRLSVVLEKNIAWTQMIKCNPPTNKMQYPATPMWHFCPDYILKQELIILKPRYLLILGTTKFKTTITLLKNIGYKGQYVGWEKTNKQGGIMRWRGKNVQGHKISVIGVYHPMARSRYVDNHYARVLNALKTLTLP
jgi:uracil-DNA glycosylase